jgi:hypothetical protein
MPTYIVRCQVSGGVTGLRQSICKSKDGTILRFDSPEAAQAYANRLNQDMNHTYSTANFRYWVTEGVD